VVRILTEHEFQKADRHNWEFSVAKAKEPFDNYHKMQEAIEDQMSPVEDPVVDEAKASWLWAE